MGRSPCCAKEGLNRGAWTAMEDKTLTDYIKTNGEGHWRGLPKRAGLKRCGKSCRLRWLNYLRPDIKRGNITGDEEELIVRLHKLLGNRWSLIAGRLPGRTDNEIKNYWNTNLSKKVEDGVGGSKSRESEKLKARKSRVATEAKGPEKPTCNVAIRTKAVKCTRVFIRPPPLLDPPTRIDNDSSTDDDLNIPAGSLEDPLLDFQPTDFDVMGAEFNFSDFLESQQMLDICFDFSNQGDPYFSPSPPAFEDPIARIRGCDLDLDIASGVEFWLRD